MKFSLSRFLVFPSSRLLILAVAAIVFITQPASAQVVDIPDANLERAIRETLNIPPLVLSPSKRCCNSQILHFWTAV